jgi:hypothetical protein
MRMEEKGCYTRIKKEKSETDKINGSGRIEERGRMDEWMADAAL